MGKVKRATLLFPLAWSSGGLEAIDDCDRAAWVFGLRYPTVNYLGRTDLTSYRSVSYTPRDSAPVLLTMARRSATNKACKELSGLNLAGRYKGG